LRSLLFFLVLYCAPVYAEEYVVQVQSEINRLNFLAPALDAYTPQSMLSQSSINAVATPLMDFASLATLMPSFNSSAPNGNGFDAGKNMTLRGFQDGQFNITMDGIPFADPDTLKHHSTSFFPLTTIDHLMVDRSPGNATTSGYATLGGSINIYSAEIPLGRLNEAYFGLGSFGTEVIGAKIASSVGEEVPVRFLINYEHDQSNGVLSLADGKKDNLFFKAQAQLGSFQITSLYSINLYSFANPPSVTTQQIANYGNGFGFTNQAGTPTYAGYADTSRRSDFGYIRINSELENAWRFKNTLYTYSYSNNGLSIAGDSSSSSIGANLLSLNPSDIAGYRSINTYRTSGNLIEFAKSIKTNTIKTGLWLEHSSQYQSRNALDLTTGAYYDANTAMQTSTLYSFNDQLDTVQPYAEFEYFINDRLSIRPGIRYQWVTRTLNADVLPTSLPGTQGQINKSFTTLLPSLEVRYFIAPTTSIYAQTSEGAMIPLLSYFNTANPSGGNLANPQTGRSFQVGLNQLSKDFNFSIDAYQVIYSNYVNKVTINNMTEYINNGDVLFHGIEMEGNYKLTKHLSLFANGSLMEGVFLTDKITSATQKAGDSISFVPHYLALCGLIYSATNWTGSIYNKWAGSEYQGKNGSSDGMNYFVGSYSYLNLSLAHRIPKDWLGVDSRVSFQVNNLLNHGAVTDTAGPSIQGPLLVNVLPPRGFMLTLAVSF
jgi:iron complex outermembrane receptor protein